MLVVGGKEKGKGGKGKRRGEEKEGTLAADNWIERFHSALGDIRGAPSNPLSMSGDQLKVMIQRYSTLIELAQDFVYTAKT